MNTQSIPWEQSSEPSAVRPRRSVLSFYYFADQSLKYLAGAVSALAVIFGVVLAINNPGLILYVQVATFTTGLVFLGLAIDAEKGTTSLLAVVTGLALPALAYLSQDAGQEWLIVAAGVVAAWLAISIFQYSRAARR